MTFYVMKHTSYVIQRNKDCFVLPLSRNLYALFSAILHFSGKQRIIRIASYFVLSQSYGNSHPCLSALCAHFRYAIKNMRMIASKLAHPHVPDSVYALRKRHTHNAHTALKYSILKSTVNDLSNVKTYSRSHC